jgi:SPX domain protein involved in polyphosphate accumulation
MRETTEQMADQHAPAPRYERKFVVLRLDASGVRTLVKLHPSMFCEAFPPRYVNNLYLDTPGLNHYTDNLNGAPERCKVRIRWYGDLFGKVGSPRLEFKARQGLVGTKQVYPFAPFVLDDRFCQRYYDRKLSMCGLPADVTRYVRDLAPVLCNRYYRWYYASRDSAFRITVDTEMTFYPVQTLRNHFARKRVDSQRTVLEIKYGQVLDTRADRVSGFFPFGVTKHSKYVTGIELVYP